jgi:hypothetical protein
MNTKSVTPDIKLTEKDKLENIIKDESSIFYNSIILFLYAGCGIILGIICAVIITSVGN